MSKAHSAIAPTIPVGILVSDAPKPPQRERPAPAKVPCTDERSIPWLPMAVVGSIAWVFLIAVVGVCSVVQVRSDVAVEQKPVILSMPIAAPAIVEMPMELPDNIRGDDLVEAAHVPGIEVPVILLKPNRQPPMNELPPMAIEIKPEPPAAPTPVTPPKRKRPALDTTIFASCDQIGTDIHFMREPLDAFQRAREEKKLVYVMHLSGNLEDKDFT